MSYLLFGALAVKAMNFQRLPDERGGGGQRRTINGQLRGRSDWVKRAYSATVLAADDAELAAILAIVDADTADVISGALPGASVTCLFTRDEIDYVRYRNEWVYSVPVTMREA